MRKRIIYGSVVLGVFVFVQLHWFSRAYDANATSFDHMVSSALYEAGDTISEKVVVEKKSANYFFVQTNTPATSETVDSLIQKAFSARNITMDYEIGVYNAEDDTLIHVTQIKSSNPTPLKDLRIEADGVQKNFAVMFPSRSNFLISQADIWPFLVFLILLIAWLSVQWTPYFANQKSSEPQSKTEILLGNSRLDFHNQNLTVDNTTFQLTYKENQILKLFFENPNQVVERDVFLKDVWEKDGFFVARSMDVFISRVRKYLSNDKSIRIENLRAIGYRLVVTR
ncbi:MAG: winged helix-turn-helix domain-containing protein [Marinoscillum sp.]